MNSYKLLTLSTAVFAFAVSAIQAQQTWSGGATGTWDNASTANWDGGATWLNGSDAVFGSGIDLIQLDAGVTVGDLTLDSGAGTVNIQSLVDDTALTLVGSPTWAMGSNTLHLVNSELDTLLNMTAGETLTVTGAGTFNTGERPTGSNYTWNVNGSTLDFQGGTLRGNTASVGEFAAVNMVGGSKFIYERNSDETSATQWTNNWDLGSGIVTFDNRFSRSYKLNGMVSGEGTMLVENMGGGYLQLNGANNTFSGGVIVDGNSRLVISQDYHLGVVPVAFETNNITLRNGGGLKVTGSTALSALRGVVLEGGGSLISDNYATYNGIISGEGDLQVNLDGSTGKVNLRAANTFTGNVDVVKGRLFIYDETNLGVIPTTLVTNSITLRDLAVFKMNKGGGMTIDANRGFTLDGGGTVVNASAPHTFNGPITGTGGLTIGITGDGSANVLTLNSTENDYEGWTRLFKGGIKLGVENALPTNTVLQVGGNNGSNSRFYMNGFDQTVAGLPSTGSNTREIINNGTSDSTLTINAVGAYTYGANINGSTNIHLIKNGSGRQAFTKTAMSKAFASITINEGFIQWNGNDDELGTVTVNDGGKIGGSGTLNDVVFNSGSRIAPGYWVGALKFSGDADLSAICSDNSGGLEITFDSTVNDSIVAASGTISLGGPADFSLGMSDFSFADNFGIVDGVYTVMVASAFSGNLDPTDRTGPVGQKGATGTLSITGTEVLITVVAGDYSDYGLWASSYQLSGDAAVTNADPDADNYNNIQEYAYGGNPTNSAEQGYVPVSEIVEDGSTNWLTYTYSYLSATNSGVSVSAETTDDLMFGAWETNGVTLFGVSSNNAPYITYTNGIPMDETIDFIGVFVEQTP